MTLPPADRPADPPVPAPSGGYGKVVVRGMIWGTVGLTVAKASSFIQTIFVGHLFGSGQYGTVAAALSAAMIGDVLTDGGLRRVLITRGTEYARIARTVFWVALAFNLVGCTLMLAAAPFYRSTHPDALPQLAVYGFALVLSTFSTIQRCKQSIDMEFGRAAFMGTVSSILRNACIVLFAYMGFGPLAFALPLIVVNVWETVYLRLYAGRVPRAPVDGALARELIGQGRWVIFAMLGASLVARGDYLVATWLLLPFKDATGTLLDIAGQYFFAFQLTLALFSPLSVGMAGIIQPVMARLSDDPARQAAAFLRMVRTALFLAVPASLGAVLVVPLMVHVLWPSKPEWHACIGAIQFLAATEAVRQLSAMSLATLEARGEFRRSAVLITIDGVLVMIAALVGCWFGTLMSLAIAVGIQRTLSAVAQAIHAYHRLTGRRRVLLIQIVPPLVLATPLALGAMAAVWTLDPTTQHWVLAAASVPAVLAYAGLARLMTPARFAEAWELLSRRKR